MSGNGAGFGVGNRTGNRTCLQTGTGYIHGERNSTDDVTG